MNISCYLFYLAPHNTQKANEEVKAVPAEIHNEEKAEIAQTHLTQSSNNEPQPHIDSDNRKTESNTQTRVQPKEVLLNNEKDKRSSVDEADAEDQNLEQNPNSESPEIAFLKMHSDSMSDSQKSIDAVEPTSIQAEKELQSQVDQSKEESKDNQPLGDQWSQPESEQSEKDENTESLIEAEKSSNFEGEIPETKTEKISSGNEEKQITPPQTFENPVQNEPPISVEDIKIEENEHDKSSHLKSKKDHTAKQSENLNSRSEQSDSNHLAADKITNKSIELYNSSHASEQHELPKDNSNEEIKNPEIGENESESRVLKSSNTPQLSTSSMPTQPDNPDDFSGDHTTRDVKDYPNKDTVNDTPEGENIQSPTEEEVKDNIPSDKDYQSEQDKPEEDKKDKNFDPCKYCLAMLY